MYGATIGKLGLLEIDAACNQACAAFTPVPRFEYITHFLFYYLLSERENLRALGKGGAQPNISQQVLRRYPVWLPPLAEQRRIADKITTLDTHSRAARKHLDAIPPLLEQFRASVLSAAFSGRLTADWREEQKRKGVKIEPADTLLEEIREHRLKCAASPKERQQVLDAFLPSDISLCADGLIGESLPSSWLISTLGTVGTVCNGSTPSRKRLDFWGPGIPWVSSGEVRNTIIAETRETITPLGFESTSIRVLPRGSVLLAMIGEGKTRGQSAVLDVEATINQNIAAILLPEYLLDSAYVWRWLQFRYRATREKGSGSGPQALNCQRVRELPIVLAPHREQNEIVRRVKTLFAFADAVEKQVAAAAHQESDLTRSILEKALRGELVPQEPNDEPATELLKRIAEEKEKMQAAKKETPRKGGRRGK
jgi:type I restriction enzyme S subunit